MTILAKQENKEKTKFAISALIQPKDRSYRRKGKKREEHLEIKNDEFSHALCTGGDTLVVIKNENDKNAGGKK